MRQQSAGTFRSALSLAILAGCLAIPFQSATASDPARPAAGSEWGTGRSGNTAARPFVVGELTLKARNYYRRFWGVDILGVKPASSGQLLRFSYRIVDPARAAALNDEHASPFLVDERTGAKLVVPQMENVGKLRETSTPLVGKEYWILFSNKGYVKPGSRVDVVIGHFRVNGLVVEPS